MGKYLCDYTEEEYEAMSENDIENSKQCGNSQCFNCYGDSTY